MLPFFAFAIYCEFGSLFDSIQLLAPMKNNAKTLTLKILLNSYFLQLLIPFVNAQNIKLWIYLVKN